MTSPMPAAGQILAELRAELAANSGGDTSLLQRIHSARKQYPAFYPLALLYGNVLARLGRESAALKYFDDLDQDFPQRAETAMRRAELQCQLERVEEAQTSLARARELGVADHRAIRLEMALHTLQGQDREGLLTLEGALAVNPRFVVSNTISEMVMAVHGEEEGIGYLAGLCRQYPDNAQLVNILAKLLNSCGRFSALFELYRSHKSQFDDSALAAVMRLDVPADLLADQASYVTQTSGAASRRRRHIAQRWQAVHEDDFPTDRIVNHSEEAATLKIPGSVGTVLYFTGLQGGIGRPGQGAEMELFAQLGLSCITLQDDRRLLYLKGIRSLGDDYRATLARLRELIEQAGSPRLFVFSTSAGGFAAIRYGLELGAECAVCLSPPCNLTSNFLQDDPRGKIIQRRLREHFPDDELDLRSALQQRESAMRIHLYYGQQSVPDRRHARHLANLPNVSLHPFAGTDAHVNFTIVREQYDLAGILRDRYRLNAE